MVVHCSSLLAVLVPIFSCISRLWFAAVNIALRKYSFCSSPGSCFHKHGWPCFHQPPGKGWMELGICILGHPQASGTNAEGVLQVLPCSKATFYSSVNISQHPFVVCVCAVITLLIQRFVPWIVFRRFNCSLYWFISGHGEGICLLNNKCGNYMLVTLTLWATGFGA